MNFYKKSLSLSQNIPGTFLGLFVWWGFFLFPLTKCLENNITIYVPTGININETDFSVIEIIL